MKQNIFHHTIVFVPHLFVFIRKRVLFDTLPPIVHTETTKNADGNALFSAPFSEASVFTSPHYKRSVFKKIHFRKAPLLKPFSKASVFISMFGRFCVDERRKRIQKYTFPYENGLSWDLKLGPRLAHTERRKGRRIKLTERSSK